MKKFNKKWIYYHLTASVFYTIAVAVAFVDMLFNENSEGDFSDFNYDALPFFIAGLLVFYTVQAIYALLYYKASGYELNEKDVRCKRGVLFRKSSVLEYSRIHSVNKKQRLLHRLFGIAVLTIDSGSANTAYSAEITIIESESVVNGLMSEIKQRQSGKPMTVNEENAENVVTAEKSKEKKSLYSFTSNRKVAYSAVNLFGTFCVFACIMFVGLSVPAVLSPYINYGADKSLADYIGIILAVGVAVILIGCILSFVISIASIFIAYHDFGIYKNDDELEISYGLFTKNTNTFRFDRIKGVVINQGILKRLFGFVTVNLEVVGYGVESGDNGENGKTNVGVLMPLCKASEVNARLAEILPDYVPQKREQASKSFPAFILWHFLAVVLLIAVPAAIAIADMAVLSVDTRAIGITAFSCAALIVLILLTSLADKYLEFRSCGITVDDRKISVYNGGLIRKCTVVAKKDIIAMEDITTPMRAKKGIFTFVIHYYTNSATNTVVVRNIDSSLVGILRASVNS